jgi:inner membrane protease ATP23
MTELSRGNLGFAKHHQACVKRRSILSLKQSGMSESDAQLAVENVWDNCFNDTAPFDEIY